MTIIALIFLLFSPSQLSAQVQIGTKTYTYQDFGFEPSNKLNCEVLADIAGNGGDLVEYSYTLKNSSTSVQPVIAWRTEIDEKIRPISERMPAPTWANSGCCMVDDVRKSSTGISVFGWLIDEDDAMIPPGKSLGPFKINATSIPGIKKFFIEGYTLNDLPTTGETIEGSEEDFALVELTNYFNNSFSGTTIGPDPVPEIFNPAELIDRLILFKHQSKQSGWIYGPGADGIVNSLDVKLEAARKSILENKNKTAVNQLRAFINEVEAQRNKHLNYNAYYLLKVNAEFIVSGLGL